MGRLKNSEKYAYTGTGGFRGQNLWCWKHQGDQTRDKNEVFLNHGWKCSQMGICHTNITKNEVEILSTLQGIIGYILVKHPQFCSN